MIPYEVDPSLHNNKPPEPALDDGFSPPEAAEPTRPEPETSDDEASKAHDPLDDKSGF